MPRKTKVEPATRVVEETCPSCKGKGTVIQIDTFMKPSGVAYEYTGEFSHRKQTKRNCIRCGGRGVIRVWRDREA